jgi:hypothetical protein
MKWDFVSLEFARRLVLFIYFFVTSEDSYFERYIELRMSLTVVIFITERFWKSHATSQLNWSNQKWKCKATNLNYIKHSTRYIFQIIYLFISGYIFTRRCEYAFLHLHVHRIHTSQNTCPKSLLIKCAINHHQNFLYYHTLYPNTTWNTPLKLHMLFRLSHRVQTSPLKPLFAFMLQISLPKYTTHWYWYYLKTVMTSLRMRLWSHWCEVGRRGCSVWS